MTSATRSYFEEQDLFGRWLDEEYNVDRDGTRVWFQSSSILFESWSKYAKARGEPFGNTKSFAAAMRRHGVQSEHKKSGTVWQGIDLKPTYRQAKDGFK